MPKLELEEPGLYPADALSTPPAPAHERKPKREEQKPYIRVDSDRLPAIRNGKFVTQINSYWDNSEPGYDHSMWDNKINSLLDPAIRFQSSGRYINPSRVHPALIKCVETNSYNSTRYELHTKPHSNTSVPSAKPVNAIFLSPICVESSSLTIPCLCPNTTRNVWVHKRIRGRLMKGEWERMQGTICTRLGQKEVIAEIWGGIITFATPPNYADSGRRVFPSSIGSFVDTYEDVPIHDATGLTSLSSYNEHYLDNIRHYLPRWRGEIPKGACAIVAYNMAYYRKPKLTNGWQLYTNVRWAIVLGVPARVKSSYEVA